MGVAVAAATRATRCGRWTDWVQARSRPVQALIGLVFLVLAAALAYAAWYVYLR